MLNRASIYRSFPNHSSHLVKRLVTRPYTISIENPRLPQPSKPKISQFSHAIFNTLVMALGTYLFLNTVWTNSEYYELEKKFKQQSTELEQEIQALVDLKNNELQHQQQQQQQQTQRWFRFLKFWK